MEKTYLLMKNRVSEIQIIMTETYFEKISIYDYLCPLEINRSDRKRRRYNSTEFNS